MNKAYSPLLFWLSLTIGASLMLYHTSDRVNALDRQLRIINTQIEAEQQSLHILKAEWVYLASPTRVAAEAQRHLALQPTAPRHVAMMNDMAALLPLRDGVESAPPVQTADASTTAAPAPVPVAAPLPQVSHNLRERVIASATSGHINDHMIMQHASKIEASTDRIGALIGTLGLHP